MFAAAGAGLMGIFTVVRHTRDDAEQGRLELVGSAAVGRQAPLAAALALALGSGPVLIPFIAPVQVVLGYPVAGSLALGTAVGCFRPPYRVRLRPRHGRRQSAAHENGAPPSMSWRGPTRLRHTGLPVARLPGVLPPITWRGKQQLKSRLPGFPVARVSPAFPGVSSRKVFRLGDE